jgi:tetratricopeptide (TPR) repeat protein
VLVKRGIAELHAGDAGAAIETQREVLAVADPAADHRLYYTAAYNLAHALTEVGRFAEAAKLLTQHEGLYRALDDPGLAPIHHHLQGRQAWGLGRREQAEELLLVARNEFLAQDKPLQVAVTSLDLAALYLEQGRTAEVKRMARLVGEVFQAQEVTPLVMAAAVAFEQAVAAERLTLEVIERLRCEMEQAARRPAAGGRR